MMGKKGILRLAARRNSIFLRFSERTGIDLPKPVFINVPEAVCFEFFLFRIADLEQPFHVSTLSKYGPFLGRLTR